MAKNKEYIDILKQKQYTANNYRLVLVIPFSWQHYGNKKSDSQWVMDNTNN